GVVHHTPHGHGQPAQGEQVERVVEAPHAQDRDEERHRDGDRGDDGGADRQQEDQDDEDRESEAQEAFLRHGGDGVVDERRLVEHHGDADVVTELVGGVGGALLYLFGDFGGV